MKPSSVDRSPRAYASYAVRTVVAFAFSIVSSLEEAPAAPKGRNPHLEETALREGSSLRVPCPASRGSRDLANVTPATYGETDRRCRSPIVSVVPPCPDARRDQGFVYPRKREGNHEAMDRTDAGLRSSVRGDAGGSGRAQSRYVPPDGPRRRTPARRPTVITSRRRSTRAHGSMRPRSPSLRPGSSRTSTPTATSGEPERGPPHRLSASTSVDADSSRRSTSTSATTTFAAARSEEHTSELQSRGHLVCRLLLEKKK